MTLLIEGLIVPERPLPVHVPFQIRIVPCDLLAAVVLVILI